MDSDGGIVATAGWVDICTRFHRAHPLTEARCRASNEEMRAEIRRTCAIAGRQCQNGLWDYAWPLVAEGRYLGSVWAGQFLVEPPDEAWFRAQARTAGIDEEQYIVSLRRVPVLAPERVQALLSVFGVLARMLALLMLERVKEREAHARLEATEMRYATLAEGVPDAVYILDREGTVVYLNGAAAKMLGRPADELIGRPQHELFPKAQARHKLAIDRVFETGQPLARAQLRESMAVGDIWIDAYLTPLKDRDGKVFAMMGISRDITDRVTAEETLRRSEEKFRTLVENTEDLIVRWGPHLELVHMNRAALSVLGLDPGASLGRRVVEVAPKDSWAVALEPLVQDVLASGEPKRGQIATDGDGASLYLDYRLDPEKDGAGSVESVLGVVRDITALRRAQAAVIRSERLAAVGTLASGVAHEFNNVHTVVLGHLEVLERSPRLSAEDRALVETIREAALRATGVTQNILTFARAARSERRRVSLRSVVEDGLQFMTRALATDGITVEAFLGDAPDVEVDPSQISQVLMNLLLNSRDALIASAEKKIAIECGVNGRGAYLEVRDTGCGIPAEDLNKILSPFFTTKGEHAKPGSPLAAVRGTGLGLSVSSRLLELNNAELHIDSEVGRGTTVTVQFLSAK
jgi:PAS domain S-box-containing protein